MSISACAQMFVLMFVCVICSCSFPSVEQLKLSQLLHLEEGVEEVKRQKQQEAAAVETQEE